MSEPQNEYQRIAEQKRRDQLVLSHLPLVKHIIHRVIGELPPGVDIENLESAGVLGLVEAAAKYDPARNAQFKTFAYQRVRGAIYDEMRRNSMFPQQVLERVAAIRRAYRTVAPPATVAELARITGLSENDVSDTLANMRLTRMLSWEDVAHHGANTLTAPPTEPESEMERRELLEHLTEAIESLPERTRTLLVLYYREDLRLKEISEVIGLSISRVSRLLSNAVFELREQMRKRNALDTRLAALVPQAEES